MDDIEFTAYDLPIRPRRNRRNPAMRGLMRETHLSPSHLIYPLFLIDGQGEQQAIGSMPGVYRWSIDGLVAEAKAAHQLGVPAVALFPALDESLKDKVATESTRADGLLQRAIRELKDACPDLLVITDVAMDPYSSDGHDGYVKDGEILNDPTLDILAEMAVSQAQAGADIVAPSDMMDGRVGILREALDDEGFEDVGILAYSVKYASSFYGPFREALDSEPRAGDKKTYQMDPANAREAIREVLLDVEQGADIVMVKPGLPYLDVIHRVRQAVTVPVAAYQVSGEYAMIQAVAQNGWMDGDQLMLESLLAFRRAGCDMVLSYFAHRVAQVLG